MITLEQMSKGADRGGISLGGQGAGSPLTCVALLGDKRDLVFHPGMEPAGRMGGNPDQRLIYFYGGFLLVSEMMLMILVWLNKEML